MDWAAVVQGGFACLFALLLWHSWHQGQRSGQPLHFRTRIFKDGQQHHLQLEMRFFQMLCGLGFFLGVGVGILGFAFRWPLAQAGIPFAALSALILITSVLLQYQRALENHRKAQGMAAKAPPWGALMVLLVGVFLVGAVSHQLLQRREQAMVSTLDNFLQALKHGPQRRAWRMYQPQVRRQLDLETFLQAVDASGFATMQLLERHLRRPFRGSYGELGLLMRSSTGELHHFSVVFGGPDSAQLALFKPEYAIRRFRHSNPRIRRGIESFIQLLAAGETNEARRMAFLHRRDADGERYTLSGDALRQRAQELGLLDQQHHYPSPDRLTVDGQVLQPVIIQGQEPQRVLFKIGLSARRSRPPGHGVSILNFSRE